MVFPGTQGGPLMHVIAAKAVAFQEALQPEFKTYSAQVIANARAMTRVLQQRGYKIVSGGTDNHLFLLESRRQGHHRARMRMPRSGRAHMTVNKNAVPNDPRPPAVTSGLGSGRRRRRRAASRSPKRSSCPTGSRMSSIIGR